MKKRIKKNLVKCIYCGKLAKLTYDHIPPKNLFPIPRPTDLITVPACRRCNHSASKDDEYFRLMLIIRDDVFEQPEVAGLWDIAYRGLKRPKSRGFTKNLLVNIKRIPEYSPSGIYLGNRGSYNVDLKRLDNVIERIIRGLFYHHFGYRLPTSHIAKSFAADGLKDPNIWLEPNIRRSIEYVSQQPKNDIGGGIFSYKFKEIEDDPNSSVWLMMFFNSVFFVGFTFANKDS